MYKDQKKERYAQWEALIEEHEKSGLSQLKFCQKKSIASTHFSYYRSRIKAIAISKKNVFVPIHLKKDTAMGDMQLILPNGLKCVLPCSTEAISIKRIVGALLAC